MSTWAEESAQNAEQDDLFLRLEACGTATERAAVAEALIAAGHDRAAVADALAWLAPMAVDLAPIQQELRATTGRYLQIVQGLGAGAQGTVDVAYDQYLDRHVAIKRFHRVGAVQLEYARREAAVLARVLHPAIATVFDFIESPDDFGIVMQLSVDSGAVAEDFAMERIGRPLVSEDVPEDHGVRPTSIDEAVGWIAQIAEGLHQVHLRKAFHRDIKPANILITPGDRQAMLVDFGIAVIREDTPGVGKAVDLIGSPRWMAPEVARRSTLDTNDANARIDVYGLGATLYTLLAGFAPQCEPWRFHDSTYDVLEERRREEHTPLHLLPGLRRPVPARLSAIVEKAMWFVPDGRYETPGDLAADLRRYLAGEPTGLDGPWVRASMFVRARPATVAMAALTLMAAWLLAAAAPSVMLRHELDQRRVELRESEMRVMVRSVAVSDCLAWLKQSGASDDARVRCRRRLDLLDNYRVLDRLLDAKETTERAR